MIEAFTAAMVLTIAAQISPGPNLMAVASSALGQGRRAGVFVAAGIACGAGLWGLSMALGLGALLELYPSLLTAISLVGGAYLLWLGVKGLRAAWTGKAGTLSASTVTRTTFGNWRHGFLIVATNPKAALMWAAVAALLFGQGLDWPAVLAFAPVGAGSAFAIYGTYAVLFSTGIAMRTYARFARVFETAFGIVFGAMGAGLILLGLRGARA